MSRSKDYIFKKNNDTLELVGDFEGFYQNHEDPWDQNSNDSDMSGYYNFSRQRLINCIKSLNKNKTVVEVGCGLGIVTSILQENLNTSEVSGIDISQTAIQKAKRKYTNISFSVGDVASTSFKYDKTVDVIILNQMLWYILKDLDTVVDNVYKTLNNEAYLIISTAFLNEQNYGRDIIDGFDGLLEFCNNKINNRFQLIYSDIDESKTYDYNDGIVCLKKIG